MMSYIVDKIIQIEMSAGSCGIEGTFDWPATTRGFHVIAHMNNDWWSMKIIQGFLDAGKTLDFIHYSHKRREIEAYLPFPEAISAKCLILSEVKKALAEAKIPYKGMKWQVEYYQTGDGETYCEDCKEKMSPQEIEDTAYCCEEFEVGKEPICDGCNCTIIPE